MTAPWVVSKALIPAANRMGRVSAAHQGTATRVAAPARVSSPISVAVSKPRPNSSPTMYIRDGRSTVFSKGPSRRSTGPPACPWWRRSDAMLIAAMTSRKTPETVGPITPVQVRSAEESSASDEPIAVIPSVKQDAEHDDDRRVAE